jgi:hypothetical protein
LVKIAAEGIETRGPELLVTGEPHGGLLQRRRREIAAHDAPFLRARDQAGAFEHAQMLHEAGQRHAVRPCQLADAQAALVERRQHAPPCRVGQGGEDAVERGFGLVIQRLNHKVQYRRDAVCCQGRHHEPCRAVSDDPGAAMPLRRWPTAGAQDAA